MQATRGLTGRARLVHHRNRAQRLYAQQLLEEYFDPDRFEPVHRHIPVRSRAEFLPTAQGSIEDEIFESGSQLELELASPVQAHNRASETGAAAGAAAHEPDQTTQAPVLKPKLITPIRQAPTWAMPRMTFQPGPTRASTSRFRLGKFMYGCALGGAAAAVILFVVSLFFG